MVFGQILTVCAILGWYMCWVFNISSINIWLCVSLHHNVLDIHLLLALHHNLWCCASLLKTYPAEFDVWSYHLTKLHHPRALVEIINGTLKLCAFVDYDIWCSLFLKLSTFKYCSQMIVLPPNCIANLGLFYLDKKWPLLSHAKSFAYASVYQGECTLNQWDCSHLGTSYSLRQFSKRSNKESAKKTWSLWWLKVWIVYFSILWM